MTAEQILLQLQELDGRREVWTQQWERDGLSAYRQRCQQLQSRHDTLQQRLSELASEVERRQHSLEQLDQEIRQFQRELSAAQGYEASLIQHRLEPAQKHKSQQEDVLLEILLEQEELLPQLAPIEAELRENQAELLEAQTDEDERRQGLQLRLSQAQEQRRGLLKALGAELSGHYEQARERWGKGLGEARAGRCQRCRLELADHLQRQLRQGEGPLCPTCQVPLVKTGDPK